MDPLAELEALLDRWRCEVFGNSSANPVPILTSIAELLERETEVYLKLPIDPFDDRHPSRAYPDCSLGLMLKALFKVDDFVNCLSSDYLLARANFELNVISCRLLVDCLPAIDASLVFKDAETLIKQLLDWAEKADFPLHSYATGLLGAAMLVDEISSDVSYRDQTNQLVPLMLNRLNQITHIHSSNSADQSSDNIDPKDLIDDSDMQSNTTYSKPINRNKNQSATKNSSTQLSNQDSAISKPESSGVKRTHSDLEEDEDTLGSMPKKMEKKSSPANLLRSPHHNECSSSSWAEAHMSGSYQMHPLSAVMQQRFILQYLSSLGSTEYLLVHMFEHKALSYILHFIDGRKNQDIRLTFDALKFLAAFLRVKKFALEFLDHGGLPQLLRVNRHGMASSGVSICLYWLAYNVDVMERICWMKRETVELMVSYGCWLLECSHDSSRADAAMFFSLCFQFPLLLKLFDRDNGLRKLLNVLSTRGLFSDDPVQAELTDDELFSRRQMAKQVCIALKKYTRAHFVSETRKHTRTSVQTSDQECKPTIISDENVMDAVELHRQQSMQRFNWRALDRMISEDGIFYLLKIIAQICNEGIFFPGRSETVRNALEILVVCSLSPKVQQMLLKEVIRITNPYLMNHPALAVIIMCTDPKILDADCQKSALNILINFVSSNHQTRVPAPMLNSSIDTQERSTPGSGRKRHQSRNWVDLSQGLRKAIWANNGTLILPKLLTVTSPLTVADTIRALACRVYCGLAKEESIRQIMSKLPLFTDGQLQSLMKEPILPEKRFEHASFCNYCKELIELVTGTPATSASGAEPSLAEIKRQMVVAQTKIEYDRTEAYHLIHNYLNSEGFPEVAASFYKAANLSAKPAKNSIAQPMTRARSPPPSCSNITNSEPSNPVTPANKIVPVNPNSPRPVHFKSSIRTPNNGFNSGNPKSLLMQKSMLQPSQHFKQLNEQSSTITLDSILTEYLRHQHSMCKNPVATCPPFELLAPHQCPEPINRLSAPFNIASRILRRKVFPPKGGIYGSKYDRHYVYSKFRPVKLVRDPIDSKTSASCCAFSTNGQFLFVGTTGGMLKAFNIGAGVIEASYECHINEIGYIEASCDDNLIITTSPDSPPSPQCVLWTFTDIFERKHRFDNDLHAEFGKASSDRIITTQEMYARLWDTATGSLLQKYEGYHNYTCNRATLNYTDTLVLNDGVLWDVRNSTSVYKFGKFNECINGIFHPNGNEIICNSQVWDIRNFRLLRTVPAFDMCQLKFNTMGDVIFSTILDDQSEVASKIKNEFKTSFRTFDSHDYSTIATIDLKRTISDLAVSPGDEHIALIESSGNPRCFHEDYTPETTVCRLYEIGRPRYDADIDMADDDTEEEEEDEDEDEDEEQEDEDGVVYDEEDEFGDIYEGMDTEDEDDDDDEEDEDDMSNSNLSSSNNSQSPLSHDELVPFSFLRASDEDENGYGATTDDDDPSYDT